MPQSKKNKHAISLGSLGGLATAKAMTPEQRSERAKKAVKAREEKREKPLIGSMRRGSYPLVVGSFVCYDGGIWFKGI